MGSPVPLLIKPQIKSKFSRKLIWWHDLNILTNNNYMKQSEFYEKFPKPLNLFYTIDKYFILNFECADLQLHQYILTKKCLRNKECWTSYGLSLGPNTQYNNEGIIEIVLGLNIHFHIMHIYSEQSVLVINIYT